MRDQLNDLYPKRGLSPVSVSDDTAQVSQIIDTMTGPTANPPA